MNKKRTWIFVIFSVLLNLAAVNCSGASVPSNSGSANYKPGAGAWKAALDIQRQVGNDEHWVLSFTVSGDGTKILTAYATHYYGTLASDTQASADIGLNLPTPIKNNSFTLSFREMQGFSMNDYSFEGTFISSTEVKGSVTITQIKYSWTAAPVGK